MDETVQRKVENFFTQFKHQTFKKGEILIRADDAPSGIFYLAQGEVKQYAISRKGEELVLNIFKPVSFFPMAWAINGTANPFYFEAVDTVEVYKAPPEKTIEFLKENPDVAYDLLSRMFKGLDGMMMRMTHLLSGNAYARLISEIIITAKRFGKVLGDSVTIIVSEKDLAAETGLTRETVSREIKLLKKKGFVSFEAHTLVIFNLHKLEDELLRED